MYKISKQFHFCASHVLNGLPAEHPCSRLHGHNYIVEVELAASELSDVGFIVDYNDLAPFDAIIRDEFDHRHLNDVVDFQPSAEMLSEYFFRRARGFWPQVSVVRVSETGRTWASYSD